LDETKSIGGCRSMRSGRGDCDALVIRIQRGPCPALHLLHRSNRLSVLPCPASGRRHSQETGPSPIDAVGTGRLSCHVRSIYQGAGRSPPFGVGCARPSALKRCDHRSHLSWLCTSFRDPLVLCRPRNERVVGAVPLNPSMFQHNERETAITPAPNPPSVRTLKSLPPYPWLFLRALQSPSCCRIAWNSSLTAIPNSTPQFGRARRSSSCAERKKEPSRTSARLRTCGGVCNGCWERARDRVAN
jgi:hypothetical protein